MSRHRLALGCLAVALPLLASPAQPRQSDTPRESGIVESTATRLVQIDVSVSGPRDAIQTLQASDFLVKVNHEKLESFQVDRLCGEPPPDAPSADAPVSPVVRAGGSARPVSYLFYFDHPHLTMAGRKRAMGLARELIAKLVSGGDRAMIVSNGRGVKTIAPFTSDSEELLRTLKALEEDKLEWDVYPQQEHERLEEVLYVLNKDGVERARARARIFALDDRWRTERNVRRLSMTLGLLTEVDSPKAVLYFADTMRNNPGSVYLDLFPEHPIQHVFPELLLDHVIQEASAHDIRFYPIEAQGLSTASGTPVGFGPAGARVHLDQNPSLIGVREAQDSLVGLAAETGGAAFVNGASADKIAKRVIADLSCLYLISFDPAGLREDVPLAVAVKTRREDVTLQARGEIVIQSESARRTSRLLAAFLAPDAQKGDVPLSMRLIPTGYEDGSFSALVQVAVPGINAPGSIWDLGASLVSRERVREEGSGRISVTRPGVPAVFEREMRFSPGPYELVSAAHEVRLGQVASRRDEGSWPDLESADAVVGPIAVVQPTNAAFLRNGRSVSSGLLARDEQDPPRTDRPIALVAIVCRSKSTRHTLRIERALIGDTRADFVPMDVDLDEAPCAVVRDIVNARTMSPGYFRYEIRVLENGTEIAHGERRFPAVGPPGSPAG